jgi:hypothetical protein
VAQIEKAAASALYNVRGSSRVDPHVGARGDYRAAIDVGINALIHVHVPKNCEINFVLEKNGFE